MVDWLIEWTLLVPRRVLVPRTLPGENWRTAENFPRWYRRSSSHKRRATACPSSFVNRTPTAECTACSFCWRPKFHRWSSVSGRHDRCSETEPFHPANQHNSSHSEDKSPTQNWKREQTLTLELLRREMHNFLMSSMVGSRDCLYRALGCHFSYCFCRALPMASTAFCVPSAAGSEKNGKTSFNDQIKKKKKINQSINRSMECHTIVLNPHDQAIKHSNQWWNCERTQPTFQTRAGIRLEDIRRIHPDIQA